MALAQAFLCLGMLLADWSCWRFGRSLLFEGLDD